MAYGFVIFFLILFILCVLVFIFILFKFSYLLGVLFLMFIWICFISTRLEHKVPLPTGLKVLHKVKLEEDLWYLLVKWVLMVMLEKLYH